MNAIKLICVVALAIQMVSCQFTDIQEAMLARHNYHRSNHGAPPLVLDEVVTQVAQDWSNECVEKNQMEHRPNGIYGENIYWGYNSAGITVDVALAEAVVDAWYSEIKDYDFNNGGFAMNTGHFTQVVWKNSQRLGCGCTTTPNNEEVYCTCNYDPPGNYDGDYDANVSPAEF